MIVKQYDVFELDELKPEVREKVLDRERHINIDDDDWYRSTVEEWEARLGEIGYENARVLFSGFYSQGDGTCFEATVNLEVWLDGRASRVRYRNLERAYGGGEVSIRIHHSGRYYHEHSTTVEGSYTGPDGAVQHELDELCGLVETDKITLSREIYLALRAEYEALTSDDAVADTIRINERLFHADGCAAHA